MKKSHFILGIVLVAGIMAAIGFKFFPLRPTAKIEKSEKKEEVKEDLKESGEKKSSKVKITRTDLKNGIVETIESEDQVESFLREHSLVKKTEEKKESVEVFNPFSFRLGGLYLSNGLYQINGSYKNYAALMDFSGKKLSRIGMGLSASALGASVDALAVYDLSSNQVLGAMNLHLGGYSLGVEKSNSETILGGGLYYNF